MKTSLIALVLVCASCSGVADRAARSADQFSLQGIWLAQSESQNGKMRNVTYQYMFRADKVTFTDEAGKEMQYSFKLETTGNLKLITLREEGSLTDTTPVSVAYELDGDSLKIVFAPAGSRPTDISDRNDQELIICRRKNP